MRSSPLRISNDYPWCRKGYFLYPRTCICVCIGGDKLSIDLKKRDWYTLPRLQYRYIEYLNFQPFWVKNIKRYHIDGSSLNINIL